MKGILNLLGFHGRSLNVQVLAESAGVCIYCVACLVCSL